MSSEIFQFSYIFVTIWVYQLATPRHIILEFSYKYAARLGLVPSTYFFQCFADFANEKITIRILNFGYTLNGLFIPGPCYLHWFSLKGARPFSSSFYPLACKFRAIWLSYCAFAMLLAIQPASSVDLTCWVPACAMAASLVVLEPSLIFYLPLQPTEYFLT